MVLCIVVRFLGVDTDDCSQINPHQITTKLIKFKRTLVAMLSFSAAPTTASER
jgi:hypothetical protein